MEQRTRWVVLCVGLLGVSIASAQERAAPRPGPEHQRLGYFVGNWSTEGEMKPSDMGPGGKMTSTEKCHGSRAGSPSSATARDSHRGARARASAS